MVVLALCACSDPLSDPADAGAADARIVDAAPAIDAIGVDADPSAPDAAPGACPVTDGPRALEAGLPPTGNWRGNWRCVSECTQAPANQLATTTTLSVANDQLTWRTPAGVSIVHDAQRIDGCYHVARSEEPCTSSYAVCLSAVAATCNASPCVYVQFASFMTASGRWQVWEFRGQR